MTAHLSGELHQRRFGEGPANVLALHCGLGQGGMWRGMASALTGATVLAPDLPGHGKSPPFPEGVDVHDAAFAALALLMTDNLHLVGHSFGATLALRLAQEAEGRIASLTLVEPVFFAAAPAGAGRSQHRASEEQIFAVFDSGDLTATARAFNRLWGGGVRWDSFSPQAQEAMAQQMPFVMGTEPSLWQDRAGMLGSERMARLTCPVTLLRGSLTVPIIAEIHAGLLVHLPQAHDIVVEGAGHMLPLTHPAEVAGAVSAYF